MKTFLYVLVFVSLLAFVPGCNGDKDKDMNRHRDLPRAAPSDAGKE